jgi:hypothetical protein
VAVFRAVAGVVSGGPTNAPHRLGAALGAAGHAYRLTDEGLAVDAPPERVGEIAAAHGVVLHRLEGTAGLEQAFFRLIQDGEHVAQPEPTQEVVS